MQTENTGNEIQKMIEIGWRRKWVILVPFIVISVAVTMYGLYLPNQFRSSSSIFIEPQRVPSDYVRSTVTTDIEDRMRSITQQLTSRTKLLKVIKQLDLYPGMMAEGLPSEMLVTRMRKDLTIEVPDRRDGNFFMVHYIHSDPTRAMLAVSSVVALFIEESLQIRELQAEGTTLFIEEELEKLKTVLEEQEQAIQEYKKSFMGELPDQLDANLRMLDNLQLQLSGNQEAQREVGDRVMLIEREISRLEGQISVATSITNSAGEQQPVTNTTLDQIIGQRDVLRQRVANMEAIYTDRHPDLIAARKELSRLEETLGSVTENLAATDQHPTTPAPVSRIPAYSTEMTNLRRQLNETRPRLSALQEEEANLRRRIVQYQRRVESAPAREQQLLGLTRDYENTKANYDDLLNKKQEARLSENLEKRQKGEKFQILDQANLPEKPFLPNRPKILAMGFAGGLGLGVGLAMLMETLFPAFYSLRQLQGSVHYPIVMGLPYLDAPSERKRHRARRIYVAVGCAAAMVVLLLMVQLFLVDLKVVLQTITFNIKGML
ncbi:MAG: GNVR domain-containing protein [bacterium]|nr:GNVR domain-containing protein [bacterium]